MAVKVRIFQLTPGLNLYAVISTCFLALILSSCNEQIPAHHASLRQLSGQLDSIGNLFLETGEVLGFSIAVLSEGDTLYAKGFGYADPAKSIPVDDKTIFNIASVTKPHTAAIALKLEEEGKLNLESYLLDYFPDFPCQE